jgi:putative ABC transport system permease protein
MNIASTLAWSSLASRPARSFTAALGIGVGIATVVSVQVVDHNTILTQQVRAIEQVLGRPDVEIRPLAAGLDAGGAAPAELANDPDLAAFCGMFQGHAERVDPGAGGGDQSRHGADVATLALGPLAAESFGAYAVSEGRDLSGPAARELLVPEALQAATGVALGDKVTLRAAVPVREGCRDGERVRVELRRAAGPGAAIEFEVVGVMAPGSVGDQPLVVLPFETAAELFAGTHIHPTWWGRLRDGAVWQDFAERMKERYTVAKPKGAMIGERIDQKAFRKSLGITSCLALLLGLFVIYNAFSMALVERVREIGLLRALGLTRGEIARAVLFEGFLLACGGVVIGATLSTAMVAGMQEFGITTLGAGKPLRILEIPWAVVIGVAALGVLFALFGMAAPLLRARHLSVLDALKAGRLALRSDPGFQLRVALLLGTPLLIPLFFALVTPPLGERQAQVEGIIFQLAAVVAAFVLLLIAAPRLIQRLVELVLVPMRAWLPVEARLAEAAVRGARQRIVGTLTGLAVVVASVYVVRSVNQGFLDEVARFSDVAMAQRVFVRTRALPRGEAERLMALPEVERIDCASAEVLTPFPLRGLHGASLRAEAAKLKLAPSVVTEFERGESLLLSRFLADQMGWRAGDTVNLATFDGARPFRVGAVTDSIGYWPDDRSFAAIEMQRMEQLFCADDQEGRHFVLTLRPGADPGAVERKLAAALPPSPDRQIRSAATVKRFYLADGRRDFRVFDVILWSTAALAAIGLLNSLTIALLERRREIALLRTIGLTQVQVGRMLLAEALAIGVVGGVLAALLAAPVSKLVLDAVRVISRLELRWWFSPGRALAPFAAALAIALAAAWWPSRFGSRIDRGALQRHE